jgi:hypothetical protein
MMPELVGVGIQSLVENASRLGITWKLSLGTITSTGLTPTVLVDGDEIPIGAVPMCGNLKIDSRVYVMSIPPSGNYIVGQVAERESGSVFLTFASATTFTQVITFERPFLDIPVVVTNINASSSTTRPWISRAFSVTTTGFTLWVFAGDGLADAWTNQEVQWIAFAP